MDEASFEARVGDVEAELLVLGDGDRIEFPNVVGPNGRSKDDDIQVDPPAEANWDAGSEPDDPPAPRPLGGISGTLAEPPPRLVESALAVGLIARV